MREPYGKAVATRAGPEPWRGGGDACLQASAGERMGGTLSREIHASPGCRGNCHMPKAFPGAPLSRGAVGPCAVEDPRHVRRLSEQELGGPVVGRDGDGVVVRVVNPQGARRR